MDRTIVVSSNVKAVGYDEASETLEVEFLNGSCYQYFGVPSSIHEKMMLEPSKGRFLHTYIRNVYPYSRVA